MAGDAVRRLWALAETDGELMAAMRAATSREDVVRIAAQHGIELDPSEPLTADEWSDAELDTAAGGWHAKTGTVSYSCD